MCEAAEIQIRKINDELARKSQEEQRLIAMKMEQEVMDVDVPRINNNNDANSARSRVVEIEDNSGQVGSHIVVEENISFNFQVNVSAQTSSEPL
jgi:hypothetical protein